MPDPLEEREIGLLQVARLPARKVVVDRQDDGRVARGLGAPDDAGGDLVVVRPVELIPARTAPVRVGDLLERRGRGGAGDQRQADRSRGPGRGELALLDGAGSGRRSGRAAPAPASACRAAPARGRAWRGPGAAPGGRSASGGRPRGWRASCPRTRRRRRCRRSRGRRATRALLLELLPGHRQRRALAGEHPLRVDLAVVVAEEGRGRLGGRHPRTLLPSVLWLSPSGQAARGLGGASCSSAGPSEACRSRCCRRRPCSRPGP